ncbi:sugar transferase [Sphingomonas ursincola]|uniref:Sugar transferase n=1 Tax=Sphingomonas ursincola TaxID=56361 RepID=A0A7V8UAC9_9SPHN|nr:sugar transferase [Sphingomonas ursincola]MBA1376205.1 sugar transferase [Sphingomonas ursincola]
MLMATRQAQRSTIGISSVRSLRVQTIVALILAIILPALVYFEGNTVQIVRSHTAFNTLLGASIATFAAYFMADRVTAFPGKGQLSYILPTYGISYALVAAVILLGRIPYSAGILLINFAATTGVQILVSAVAERQIGYRVFVAPGGRVEQLEAVDGLDTTLLTSASVPRSKRAILVADLHFDHSDEWERAIAEATLHGIPVYHYKQVLETLTGKVRIEHMSENTFGSLLPSLNYARTKRAADIILTLLILPILALPMALVALAIRLESSGPAFFLQLRMGHRGVPFKVIKFRTMRCEDPTKMADARDAAMTKKDDDRITRLGRFLRRSRIDELPQLINVLKGEMSWIGPRPEAIALSEWYESELPFYSYRHIVRPGITGWAQVNQGHVTNLDDISAKLQYDFFYIKNFPYWLDLLIVFRTVLVMLNGYGAK